MSQENEQSQAHGTKVDQTAKTKAKMVNDGLYSRFIGGRLTGFKFN